MQPSDVVVHCPGGKVTAYCDGASHSNPGPAGAGVLLECPANNGVITISWPLGAQSNAVAEYHAVILALKVGRALGAATITIETDHETLVQQMRGEVDPRSAHLQPLCEEVRALMRQYPGGVEARWAPRSGMNNGHANELAGQAAGSNPRYYQLKHGGA